VRAPHVRTRTPHGIRHTCTAVHRSLCGHPRPSSVLTNTANTADLQESRKPLHCMHTRRYSHGYQPLSPHLMIIYYHEYAVKRHILCDEWGDILCDDGPPLLCVQVVWDDGRPDTEPSGTPGLSLRTAPCMLLLHTEHHNHTAYTCSSLRHMPPFTAASTL
jgi:hypothetical protein